jgi:hypothetical protein
MISLLEASAQVFNVFLMWYFNTVSISSLMISMILYDIILPHVFLMNTSENKNRIVELGWKNVLKNIVGICNNTVGNSENTATETNGVRDSNIEKEAKAQSKRRSNTPRDKIVSPPSHFLPVKNPIASAIPNVSLNGEYSGYKKDDLERPSNSTLNANALDERAHTHNISQTLISEMMESGKDEKRYMIYFKKFAAFQESRKRGKIISDIELEDQFLPDIEQSKKYTRKNSRVKGAHNKSTVLQIAVTWFGRNVSWKELKHQLKLSGTCLRWGSEGSMVGILVFSTLKVLHHINALGDLQFDKNVKEHGMWFNVHTESYKLGLEVVDKLWLIMALLCPMIQSLYLTLKGLDTHGIVITIRDNREASQRNSSTSRGSQHRRHRESTEPHIELDNLNIET